MNATAKRILPDLSGERNATDNPIIKAAIESSGDSLTIDGNVYEIRSERIQEFSSPCGWVVWLINMTKYQQRLNEINAASAASIATVLLSIKGLPTQLSMMKFQALARPDGSVYHNWVPHATDSWKFPAHSGIFGNLYGLLTQKKAAERGTLRP